MIAGILIRSTSSDPTEKAVGRFAAQGCRQVGLDWTGERLTCSVKSRSIRVSPCRPTLRDRCLKKLNWHCGVRSPRLYGREMIGASGGLDWSGNRSASLRHANLESLQDFETTEQSMDQSCCGMFGQGNRYAGLPAGILDWLMDSQQAVQCPPHRGRCDLEWWGLSPCCLNDIPRR